MVCPWAIKAFAFFTIFNANILVHNIHRGKCSNYNFEQDGLAQSKQKTLATIPLTTLSTKCSCCPDFLTG
jgi:hypothetical protein